MTETTLQRATTLSDSLRTTVPAWIVSHFKLEVGDKFNWEMKVVEGSLVLVVEPIKK